MSPDFAKGPPNNFSVVRDIVEDETIPLGRFVSVVGVVTDSRSITQTAKDFKCELSLSDISTCIPVTLTVFHPRAEDFPKVFLGDVVVAIQVKIQYWHGRSLVTNKIQSEVHVYERSRIPHPPNPASEALRTNQKLKKTPNLLQHQYVSWLYDRFDKSTLPDPTESQEPVGQVVLASAAPRNKSSLLQDVQLGRFYDIVAQVVKEPYDFSDTITLWVSDYTANDAFFDHQDRSHAADAAAGQAGDPYGYTTRYAPNGQSSWPGPVGRLSLQISCWEPHAARIRTYVKKGTWVSLRNVQVKHGKNGNSLEGFLRQDLRFPDKIQVETVAPDTCARAKEALRRKAEYEKARRHQQQHHQQQHQANGGSESGRSSLKRGAEDAPRADNSKAKRKKARKEKQRLAEEQKRQVQTNLHIATENHDQPISSFDALLNPVKLSSTDLPFSNVNYRLQARVVDFRPHDLAQFAYPAARSEFDELSDFEDSDDEVAHASQLPPDQVEWKWQFWLQLEDASADAPKKRRRAWVVVSNSDAQCLLSMDAGDFRRDEVSLRQLRERLFLLWGELEEFKKKEAARKRHLQKIRGGVCPPPDSSDTEPAPAFSNMPFACCVRQYGVEVDEENAVRANAGPGKRWQRVFGMYGTRIKYD